MGHRPPSRVVPIRPHLPDIGLPAQFIFELGIPATSAAVASNDGVAAGAARDDEADAFESQAPEDALHRPSTAEEGEMSFPGGVGAMGAQVPTGGGWHPEAPEAAVMPREVAGVADLESEADIAGTHHHYHHDEFDNHAREHVGVANVKELKAVTRHGRLYGRSEDDRRADVAGVSETPEADAAGRITTTTTTTSSTNC
ncbi:hypothetical protein HK101_011611 [Irineochytrium annulatum]|nr:hypothetical protein HK101_011611 [Irineochytrium annulatum]